MSWGILVVLGIGLFLTYVIWQETRSHLHWRELVSGGNVWAIRELVTAEIERWHEMRPPRGILTPLWAGVQTAELVAVGARHIQVACGTEAEYRMVHGRREQVSSALDEGMRLAAKLVDLLLYDIPEVKVDRVRIDVYSTFHTAEGTPEQRCILTTTAVRDAANEIVWEDLSPRGIIDRLCSHYEISERGVPVGIDPGPSLPDEDADAAMPEEARRTQRRDRREKPQE